MELYYEVPTNEDYEKAIKLGILKSNVDRRVKSGWSVKRAITTPVKLAGNVEKRAMMVLAQKNGISETTFKRRIDDGWTFYDAATVRPCKYGSLKDLREQHGIDDRTFQKRIERGMDPFEAAIKPLDNRGRKKKKQIS